MISTCVEKVLKEGSYMFVVGFSIKWKMACVIEEDAELVRKASA
jgi:hypothetical protein